MVAARLIGKRLDHGPGGRERIHKPVHQVKVACAADRRMGDEMFQPIYRSQNRCLLEFIAFH